MQDWTEPSKLDLYNGGRMDVAQVSETYLAIEMARRGHAISGVTFYDASNAPPEKNFFVCKDTAGSDNCQSLKISGQCSDEKIALGCLQTCGMCRCKDEAITGFNCPETASSGDCSNTLIRKRCPLTCGACKPLPPTESPTNLPTQPPTETAVSSPEASSSELSSDDTVGVVAGASVALVIVIVATAMYTCRSPVSKGSFIVEDHNEGYREVEHLDALVMSEDTQKGGLTFEVDATALTINHPEEYKAEGFDFSPPSTFA
jgi:hypothetical protein